MKKIKQQDKNKAELMWIIILLIGIIILFSGIHIADAQRGRGGSTVTAPVVDTTKIQDVYEVMLHVDNKANVNLEGLRIVKNYLTKDSHIPKNDTSALNIKILSNNSITLSSILSDPNFVVLTDPSAITNETTQIIYLLYSKDAKYLKVYYNNTEKLSFEIKDSLCNNDSVCNNYENYYSCPADCSIGAKDKTCVSNSGDGICDPDCIYDGDCDSDADGIINSKDNCKGLANSNQLNSDDFSVKKPLLYDELTGTKGELHGGSFVEGKHDAGYLAVPTLTAPIIAPTSGLVLHLTFDEGSGSIANDNSNYNNDGTNYGAAWVDGKFGKALGFDGVNDYVYIKSSDSLKPSSQITLSCWLKLESYKQNSNPSPWYSSCISKTSGPTGAYVAAYKLGVADSTGVPFFEIDDNNVAAYGLWGSSALSLNNWHHLTGTYDGSTMMLYVDGALVSSIPRTGSIDNSDYPLQIGNAPNEYAEPDWYSYLNGAIDEVRIYNRALPADEVNKLYVADAGGITYNTQGNFNKDKGTIEYWIKPNWDGNDKKNHWFLDEGQNPLHSPNHMAIGKLFGGGCNCDYMFFVIDDASWTESTAWATPTQHEINTAYNASFLNSWKAGEWHHIAATWDSTAGMSLYVDGILIGSNTNKWARSETGANIYLGSNRGMDPTDAVIDEFKIYDSALSAGEIKAEYLGKLKDELGDACDPCPYDPSDLCSGYDEDNDGILNENDLCPGTEANSYNLNLTKTQGCSCEQVKQALSSKGQGYAKGVLSDKNTGICRAAEKAKGLMKTGKVVEEAGFGEWLQNLWKNITGRVISFFKRQ